MEHTLISALWTRYVTLVNHYYDLPISICDTVELCGIQTSDLEMGGILGSFELNNS